MYEINFRIVATYETALMRSYFNGRTETVRSVQCDTVDWVMSFLNESEHVKPLVLAIHTNDKTFIFL